MAVACWSANAANGIGEWNPSKICLSKGGLETRVLRP